MCEGLDTFLGNFKTYMRVRVGHISPLYGYTFRSSLSSLSFTQPFTLIFRHHTIPSQVSVSKTNVFHKSATSL